MRPRSLLAVLVRQEFEDGRIHDYDFEFPAPLTADTEASVAMIVARHLAAMSCEIRALDNGFGTVQ